MDVQQAATIRRKLTLLGRTRDQLRFLYTPAGPEGAPVLLVDAPRLPPASVLALTRQSMSRDFVRGDISRDIETGQLTFSVQSGSAQGLTRFVGHLQGWFVELVPALVAAKVRPASAEAG
jgi:hypothetical protein